MIELSTNVVGPSQGACGNPTLSASASPTGRQKSTVRNPKSWRRIWQRRTPARLYASPARQAMAAVMPPTF